MKVTQIIAVIIILSIALVPLLPVQTHAASSSYSEKFSSYIAGTNAAWFVTVSNVNLVNRHFAAVESVGGVGWYNLTAIDTASWTTDFQVFGPQGYNVLPVPFVPLQGAFLSVGASSYTEAAAAATDFDSYLLTDFQSISNSSSSYTFFAPFDFAAVAPSTLLSLVPFNSTGFMNGLAEPHFEKLPSQMITIEGTRGASGFSHGIVVGSIVTGALDSDQRPAILTYFGSTLSSIKASNVSSSSTITVHALDGLVLTTDNVTATSNTSAFSGTYVLSLKPGESVYRLNATIVQQPVQLLATRVIDVGVLTPGTNMSVTINLSNLSNSTSITGISYSDLWWKSSGLFKLVSGSANQTGMTLQAGKTSTPTYVLQYVGNESGQFQIPVTTVDYVYLEGTSFFHASTALNPITISLGVDEPVVYAYLAPQGRTGRSIGTSQPLSIKVTNAGTRTASSVSVAGQSLGGLAPGTTTSAAVTVSAPSLTQVNVTKSYQVTYVTPEGTAESATTNAFSVVFTHSSMQLALAFLRVNSTVTQLSGTNVLNLTMDFTNSGRSTVNSFSAQALLPDGLGCGKAGGVNVTCNASGISLHYSNVPADGQAHSWMSFNITTPRNYVFPPFQTTVLTSGYNLTAVTNAIGAPSGLVLTKQFGSASLFTGMSTPVKITALNQGPYGVYNATVITVGDSFDQPSSSARTTETVGNITAGSNFNFNYTVTASLPARNAPSAAVTAGFYFAGSPVAVTQEGPTVSVFGVLTSAIASSPSSPVEGKSFAISVTLTNPASVPVSNVQFLLPVPSGVTLTNPINSTVSKEGLSVSLAQLAAGAKYVATVEATASSGESIPFSGAKFSFGYRGSTLKGSVPASGIAVGENVTVRYEIPIALITLAMLATAYYVRKISGPIVPASQK